MLQCIVLVHVLENRPIRSCKFHFLFIDQCLVFIAIKGLHEAVLVGELGRVHQMEVAGRLVPSYLLLDLRIQLLELIIIRFVSNGGLGLLPIDIIKFLHLRLLLLLIN